MIQRIQSIYLFLAVCVLMLLTANPFARILLKTGDVVSLEIFKSSVDPFSGTSGIPLWPLAVLLVTVLALLLLVIFFYRKRVLQVRLCMLTILIMFGFEGMIYLYTKLTIARFQAENSLFLWPALIPFIAIILTYLAMKAIQKDDALVKSYERLR
jgi:peptidoglycan/LPS O-acetylase OafA/YrhL